MAQARDDTDLNLPYGWKDLTGPDLVRYCKSRTIRTIFGNLDDLYNAVEIQKSVQYNLTKSAFKGLTPDDTAIFGSHSRSLDAAILNIRGEPHPCLQLRRPPFNGLESTTAGEHLFRATSSHVVVSSAPLEISLPSVYMSRASGSCSSNSVGNPNREIFVCSSLTRMARVQLNADINARIIHQASDCRAYAMLEPRCRTVAFVLSAWLVGTARAKASSHSSRYLARL